MSSVYMRREVHSLRNSCNLWVVSWATKFFSPRKVDFKYQSRGFLPVKDFTSLNVPTCLNVLH